ncbi:MAG: ADP-ribosylation factor-like protein [Candidatus Thorarchaeota archaeon]
MLRQIHVFLNSELLFVKDYAIALGNEELKNVKTIIQKYMNMPMPGKTFQRPVSNFQIFHRAYNNLFFLFVADIVDSLQYIDEIMKKTIKKVEELFPNPEDINNPSPEKDEFNDFLNQIQRDIHSKISIVGPAYSGKTTLFNMLKTGEEKPMDFAKVSNLEIDGICFDLWDFQLKDTFSLLWSKFIKGSDLVILLFNLANYNLGMLDRFLKLHQTESSYSKLLIIGNKRDLVEDSDLKRIKNELKLPDMKEMSLNSYEAKSQIEKYIKELLGLKKPFPKNFEELVKEADALVSVGKNIQALTKYKELIAISNSYQNIIFTKALEQKVNEINNKIKKETQKRKELDQVIDFDVAQPLVFKRKVTVKPLPTLSTIDEDQEEEEVEKKITPPPSKPQKLATFQKLDTQKELKPVKVIKPPLKVIKKITPSIDISKETSLPKTDSVQKIKPKMPLEIFAPHEDITKDIDKPMVINFTQELQKIIKKKGSSLSLKLCENLITELQKSLGRPLKMEDIELAADFFVKQEKLA